MQKMSVQEINAMAQRVRAQVVRMSFRGNSPHLGSCLSCADIVVTAYATAVNIDPKNPNDPDRDRFILSKGHAAPVLYATMAERGLISRDLIEHYNQDGACLAEQPSPGCVPGLEAATGSLGHGLPLGLGMALAAKLGGKKYRVFVCMSDGECNEGSVWEAAMFAPAKKLDNVILFVDYNRWQATDRSEEVLALAPLRDKFAAFGWSAHDIDGHDHAALAKLMANVPDGTGRPIAVVCRTVKGKGVSYMLDDNNWHYRVPKREEVEAAWRELGQDPAGIGPTPAHRPGGH